MNKQNLISKENSFAVVGASKDESKYGYKVFMDLKNAGYEVYPINPKEKYIKGEKCYLSLEDLPKVPDVVITVVPPKITEEIVKQVKKLKIGAVWMQPGSESEEAIKFCKENKIVVVSNACIMVEKNEK